MGSKERSWVTKIEDVRDSLLGRCGVRIILVVRMSHIEMAGRGRRLERYWHGEMAGRRCLSLRVAGRGWQCWMC